MRNNFTVEETQAILATNYPWAVKADIVMFDSHIHLWRMDRLMREFMGGK